MGKRDMVKSMVGVVLLLHNDPKHISISAYEHIVFGCYGVSIRMFLPFMHLDITILHLGKRKGDTDKKLWRRAFS